MTERSFVDVLQNKLAELFRPLFVPNPTIQPIIDVNFKRTFVFEGNTIGEASSTKTLTLRPPKYKKWKILFLTLINNATGGNVAFYMDLVRPDLAGLLELFGSAAVADFDLAMGLPVPTAQMHTYNINYQPTLTNDCFLYIAHSQGVGITCNCEVKAQIEESLNLELNP